MTQSRTSRSYGIFRTPLVVCDTIEFWINGSRDDVVKMIEMTDGVVINDNEARPFMQGG